MVNDAIKGAPTSHTFAKGKKMIKYEKTASASPTPWGLAVAISKFLIDFMTITGQFDVPRCCTAYADLQRPLKGPHGARLTLGRGWRLAVWLQQGVPRRVGRGARRRCG